MTEVVARPMQEIDRERLAWLSRHLHLGESGRRKDDHLPGPAIHASWWAALADFVRTRRTVLNPYSCIWGLQKADTGTGLIEYVALLDKAGYLVHDPLKGEVDTEKGEYLTGTGVRYTTVVKVSIWSLLKMFPSEVGAMTNTDATLKVIASIKEAAKTKDSKFAVDVLIQGAEYYLTRALSLQDYVLGLASWVRDDSPELAEVLKKALVKFPRKELAFGYYSWNSLKTGTWYKATMNSSLGAFAEGEKVWVKINDEKPLTLGKTVWIYGPQTGRVMHVLFDIAPQYANLYLVGSKPEPADPKGQRRLDAAWQPVVQEVILQWKKQQRTADRLLKRAK